MQNITFGFADDYYQNLDLWLMRLPLYDPRLESAADTSCNCTQAAQVFYDMIPQEVGIIVNKHIIRPPQNAPDIRPSLPKADNEIILYSADKHAINTAFENLKERDYIAA